MTVANKVQFSKLTLCDNWIKQFESSDQDIAKKIIDSIYWVTENDYATYLRRELSALSLIAEIAVYCEREPRKYAKKTLPFYKQKKIKPRTFHGVAQFPIPDHAKHRVEIGSEGVTATIINNLKRKYKNILIHPTAETLKKNKIKKYVIVTDLIASGERISSLLDSFWALHSIKALNSAKLIEFHVVAYACSHQGLRRLNSHQLRPNIHYEIICPDQSMIFSQDERKELYDFFSKYSSLRESTSWRFSFGETPLYIAFEHGAPNNLPSILFKNGRKGIKPLFKGRSTSDFYEYIGKNESQLKSKAIQDLEEDKYLYWILKQPQKSQQVFILLNEINGCNSFRQLMERTLMKRSDLEDLLALCVDNEWITGYRGSKRYITDRGRKLRSKLRQRTTQTVSALEPDVEALYYCPESLRGS